jgi:predicted DNA-binding protein
MAVKDVRKVLENVPAKNLAEEIGKITIPKGVYVRVTIETIEESPKETKKKPDEVGLRFLEEMEDLPVAEDLPEDLAHQHDHYLYGLPKKS